MLMLYAIIVLLLLIVALLSASIFILLRKTIIFSKKEKEYINFVIDVFCDFGDDLGIQSKDQHKKLVDELNKIKQKINNHKNE